MKTQLCRNLMALFLLGILLSSCQIGSNKMVRNENPISFDSIQIDKSYYLLDNPSNPNCNLQINFTFPTDYDDEAVLKKIQKQFIVSYFGDSYVGLEPEKAVAQYTEDYLKAYKELEEDFKQDLSRSDEVPVGAWYSYYEMSSNEIVFNESDILSYTVSFENYTGGAHGAHSFTNRVINVKTGELITEDEIFVDNFEDHLALMLVDEIAKQNNVAEAKELENLGYFSIDEIFPNGNFLIDASGITYFFNEYEIAAYVVGVTKVHLPFAELAPLLRPDSPISQLVRN